eukprot:TRINITY_DN635_c0_g1_i10.p1 TRINITY_DN635_c0_g1~~TRINITY_DN635_c0_g1_i10.p1  ORF type:complete len:608 (+),score=81.67 TRINITY_DN635_c0_g1_i10:59-1882(+)
MAEIGIQSTAHKKNQVGPFVLGRTLGEGSTGKVRIGIHTESGSKVAVKIIKKDLLQQRPGLQRKIQREISVMKLIIHPNVVRLYDVYETPRHLYMVLEYVEGGELFDYLVRKKVLDEDEALRFFQQIICGLDYCHKHFICHRDLKPENLLLDKHSSIKIADFGMASFVRPDELQATSCGSPHYAAPEVIRGERYEGKQADVWSAGVILYALLTGRLPFDDDNIAKLLHKVKLGVFDMPSFINSDAQHLIFRMLTLDPERRITIGDIRKHRFFRRLPLEPEPFIVCEPSEVLAPVKAREHLNAAHIATMKSLGWDNQEELVAALLSTEQNLERVLYRLLQTREAQNEEEFKLFSRTSKWRNKMAVMPETEVRARSSSMDTDRLHFLAKIRAEKTVVASAASKLPAISSAHDSVDHVSDDIPRRTRAESLTSQEPTSTPRAAAGTAAPASARMRPRSDSNASQDSPYSPKRAPVQAPEVTDARPRASSFHGRNIPPPSTSVPLPVRGSQPSSPSSPIPSPGSRLAPLPSCPSNQAPTCVDSSPRQSAPGSPILSPLRTAPQRPAAQPRAPRVHTHHASSLLNDTPTPSTSPKVSWFGHMLPSRHESESE